jgi:integrase
VVTLAEARRRAHENLVLIEDGGDPLAQKRQTLALTFRETARIVYEANLKRWKAGRHTDLWLQVVEKYACPVFGDKSVNRRGREDVLSVLVPIWTSKHETARKLRQRLRIILDWAVAHGHLGQNFAADAIRRALPSMSSVKEHHRTLHYSEIGQAIESVDNSRASMSAKLLWQFLVLTAVRGGKARQATWAEIDFDEKTVAHSQRAHEVREAARGSPLGYSGESAAGGRIIARGRRPCLRRDTEGPPAA